MVCLIVRIIKQFKNDKRSLAMMLLAPLLILTLINLLLGDSSYTPRIAANDVPNAVIEELKNEIEVIVNEPLKESEIEAYLAEGRADAVLSIDSGVIRLLFYEPDNVKTELIIKAIGASTKGMNNPGAMDISFILGRADMSSFDNLGYIFLGILSFFFIFLIAGISFVRERTTGTLERLMITPIKRTEVVGGYTVGFGIFAALQSVIIVLFVKYILKMEFTGSVLLTCITMILLAFTAVSLGAFASIFANNEFQIMQLIPVVIVPQIFLSGLIPIDTIPFKLGNLAYVTPIYYGCRAIKEVLLYGAGFREVMFNLSMLVAFIAVFFILNTAALKRYRSL